MAPVVSILEGAKDVFGSIEWDQRTEWTDDGAPDVAPPAAPPPAKRSLRAHLTGVDYILESIEALDEEMTDAQRDEITAELIGALAGSRKKVDNVCAALACFEALEAASERECERLVARVEKYQKQRARLTDYVLAVMTTSKLERLDGDTSTLTLRHNPPAVQIEDGAAIPFEFMYFPEAPAGRPDKGSLKKALKSGRKIAGVKLESVMRLVRT